MSEEFLENIDREKDHDHYQNEDENEEIHQEYDSEDIHSKVKQEENISLEELNNKNSKISMNIDKDIQKKKNVKKANIKDAKITNKNKNPPNKTQMK